MCDHDSSSAQTGMQQSASRSEFPFQSSKPFDAVTPQKQGSRRYRLWELPSNTHCPLIGVCLPFSVLRRLINKALGSKPIAEDYDFHVAAVAECNRRTPVSELLQRELDRRYASTLHRFSQAKTTEVLAMFWSDALKTADVAGALWATFSHARCDETLREQVCRDIHMFQHQAGASNRADLHRLDQLQHENAALARELSIAKERHMQALAERALQAKHLETELMRCRALLVVRDSTLASLQDDLAVLKATVPGLQARTTLARRAETLQQRMTELERDRLFWRQSAVQEGERVAALESENAMLRTRGEDKQAIKDATKVETDLTSLRDKAVLCVGGRPSIVPSYRQIIECTGGKFLHHDGGEENHVTQLDAHLSAADLVICQTGCISHDAYWRVKDHCKRTGKRCVFVDKPSASSFARCLREFGDNAEHAMEGDRKDSCGNGQ